MAQASTNPAAGDDRLSAYLDGELSGADRAQVERDLAGSDAAQSEITDLREVSTLLKGFDGTIHDENPSQQFAAFVSSGGQSVSAELRAQAQVEDNLPIAPVVPVRRGGAMLRLLVAVVLAVLIYLALHYWVLP